MRATFVQAKGIAGWIEFDIGCWGEFWPKFVLEILDKL